MKQFILYWYILYQYVIVPHKTIEHAELLTFIFNRGAIKRLDSV